ncbi:MAG: ParB/RepB/Spo0J family partition protein [Alkaliphilus sp.]|nr:ParB/RepB/Spo0J family partition protein [Alkaliphilus sp.]
MIKARGGLGKGLNALIPQGDIQLQEEKPIKGEVFSVDIQKIRPNENQPRKNFNQDKLDSLISSIRIHGIIQPVIVRELDGGYQLIAGERRWKAAMQAGLKKMPCVVKELEDRERMEVALIENLQREDLNSIEEAMAYKALMDGHNLTQEQISIAVGRSRPHVANTLRLLHLPDIIQMMIVNQDLTSGHARAILAIESQELMINTAKKIVVNNLSVRETEALISEMMNKKKENKNSAKKSRDSDLVCIEDILKGSLGTKVIIVKGKKKGKIEIEYYGEEELERLVEILQNAK